jgi:hypothetical protein
MSEEEDNTSFDDDTTKTTAKTLWTETILEILYETLRKNKDDASVRKILAEVQSKGFRRDYIVEKVGKKVGAQAANRVRLLLKS